MADASLISLPPPAEKALRVHDRLCAKCGCPISYFHELYQANTSLSHRILASFDSPSTMVTYYEASPDDDGLRAVLFLDGHVKRVTEAEWQKLRLASHVPKPVGGFRKPPCQVQ